MFNSLNEIDENNRQIILGKAESYKIIPNPTITYESNNFPIPSLPNTKHMILK